MAVCSGLGILDNLGNFNPNKIGYYYSLWYLSGPFDIGTTTSSALCAPFQKCKNKSFDQLSEAFHYKPDEIYEIISTKTDGVSSLSNGFLMRKTPIACYSSLFIDFSISNDDGFTPDMSHILPENKIYLEGINYLDNRLTHFSQETMIASTIYSLIITRLIFLKFKNSNKTVDINSNLDEEKLIKVNAEKVLKYISKTIHSMLENKDEPIKNKEPLKLLLNYASKDTESERKAFTPSAFYDHMGWYFHGLSVIFRYLYLISNSEKSYTYIQIIKEIISLGGDTDTNAAIAGGVFGLLFGLNKFHDQEEDYLDYAIRLNSIESINIPRSTIYSPFSGLLIAKEISSFINDKIINKDKDETFSLDEKSFILYDKTSCHALQKMIDFYMC